MPVRAYKIFALIEDVLYSMFGVSHMIQYTQGERRYPPDKWGPIGAFDTLEHAQAFRVKMRDTMIPTNELIIFEIEGEISNNDGFWTDVDEKDIGINYPDGTLFMDWVIPIEEVA